MRVPQLLLSTLEDLGEEDFRTFKWHLVNHSTPVPRSRLENASRTAAVDKMLGVYGERSALSAALEILRKMNLNDSVEKLKKMSEGEEAAAGGEQLRSPDGKALALPTISLSAGGGASIISPILTGSSIGTININQK